MMSQTSPKSPEPHRRETVWVYSQGAPQVFQGDLDYYLGEHDLTWHQLGAALLYERILAGDRAEKANPNGHSSATAAAARKQEIYDKIDAR